MIRISRSYEGAAMYEARGEIDISYSELVDIFGEPTEEETAKSILLVWGLELLDTDLGRTISAEILASRFKGEDVDTLDTFRVTGNSHAAFTTVLQAILEHGVHPVGIHSL
jgi:hypothetical protein